MGKQLPDCDRSLGRLRKLRPVISNLGVIRNESPSDSDCDRKRGNTFRGREHVDEGVFLPRSFGDPIAEATPQIDNLDAIAVHGDSRPDLLTADHVAAKNVGDFPIPRVDVPANETGRHCDPENHFFLNDLN